jgi:hypothetical protein
VPGPLRSQFPRCYFGWGGGSRLRTCHTPSNEPPPSTAAPPAPPGTTAATCRDPHRPPESLTPGPTRPAALPHFPRFYAGRVRPTTRTDRHARIDLSGVKMELIDWPDLVGPWPSGSDDSPLDRMADLAQREAKPLPANCAVRLCGRGNERKFTSSLSPASRTSE